MRRMWFDFAHQPGDEGDEGERITNTPMPNAHLPCPSLREAAPKTTLRNRERECVSKSCRSAIAPEGMPNAQ
jgi:hypothetical protein